jgi:hypothetical protein
MGIGRREFESSCAALQTQLRPQDGRVLGEKEEQSRRAKYSPAQFGFKLATRGEQTRAITS